LGYLTSYIHDGTISLLMLDAAGMVWRGKIPKLYAAPEPILSGRLPEAVRLCSRAAAAFSH
jgi:hypothetical protein